VLLNEFLIGFIKEGKMILNNVVNVKVCFLKNHTNSLGGAVGEINY